MQVFNKTDAPVLITDLRLTVSPRGSVHLNVNQQMSKDLLDMVHSGFLRVVRGPAKRATVEVTRGSDNVFADLGLPEPEVELVNAKLALAVQQPISTMDPGESLSEPLFPEALDPGASAVKTVEGARESPDGLSAVAKLRQTRKKRKS